MIQSTNFSNRLIFSPVPLFTLTTDVFLVDPWEVAGEYDVAAPDRFNPFSANIGVHFSASGAAFSGVP